LLAHGRWFSPCSSTDKTGRHDIAAILLKVALKHKKSKKNQAQINTKMFYANMILKIKSLYTNIPIFVILVNWYSAVALCSHCLQTYKVFNHES
jgi:predicted benzoate:H+ symporter BenE